MARFLDFCGADFLHFCGRIFGFLWHRFFDFCGKILRFWWRRFWRKVLAQIFKFSAQISVQDFCRRFCNFLCRFRCKNLVRGGERRGVKHVVCEGRVRVLGGVGVGCGVMGGYMGLRGSGLVFKAAIRWA